MRSGIPDFADEAVMDTYYAQPLEPFGAEEAIRLSAAQPPRSTRRKNVRSRFRTNIAWRFMTFLS